MRAAVPSRFALLAAVLAGGCEDLSQSQHDLNGSPWTAPSDSAAWTGLLTEPPVCTDGWLVEPVASGELLASHSAGLVVDGAGAPHLVYSDLTQDGAGISGGALRYAQRGAGDWQAATIDGPRVTGLFTALATDAQGGLHALYTKRHTVEYAYRAVGGAWTTKEIDSFDDDFMATLKRVRLGVDATGTVHAIYSGGVPEPGLFDMRYAYRQPGGTWQAGDIPAIANAASADLAVAADGTLHIVYRDGDPARSLGYVRGRQGQPWLEELIPGMAGEGDPALAMDASGEVHVVAGGELGVYARRTAPGTWSVRELDAAPVGSAAVAIAPGGEVHLAYASRGDGVSVPAGIRHAQRTSDGEWVEDRVWQGEIGPDAFAAATLAVDGTGRVHLVFKDLQAGALSYAVRCE